MSDSRFSCSGNGECSFSNIPKNTEVEVSGFARCTVGQVGSGASFKINGMGSVEFTGSVASDTTINASGNSRVSFNTRPPESVLKNIIFSNRSTITVPGGFSQYSNLKPDSPSRKDDSYLVSTKVYDGIVDVTIGDKRTCYKGSNAVLNNTKLTIDGIPVKDNDNRIIPCNTPSIKNNDLTDNNNTFFKRTKNIMRTFLGMNRNSP